MSAETWIKEFYPVSAHDVESEIGAVNHSLRKWEGLRKSSLNAHGLEIPPISVSSSTCSLCLLYGCSDCPITKAIGISCDYTFDVDMNEIQDDDDEFVPPDGFDSRSPWMHWNYNMNPEPMILALQLASENCNG